MKGQIWVASRLIYHGYGPVMEDDFTVDDKKLVNKEVIMKKSSTSG